MAVETAVVAKLSADDREFNAGISRATQAAQNFTNSITQSQTKMAAMAGAIGGIASTIGMSFMQMSKNASSFAFNTVADFEQTRIGFEGIMGSAGAAQVMLDQLQQFAATTPFEFTELATSTKQLLAIGYAAEDVIPMMTKLGDATANLGLSQEAMKMTIRALGQIKGMGRPLTQDLYQIANALPGFNPFDAIAKGVGKTQAETRKMIEQGLIPADKAIAAILTGMQNMPGAAGAMQRQVGTIRGQLSNLADTIKINLIKGFQDTGGAVTALKGIVAGVGPAMAGTFKSVGAVVSVLAPIFKTLGNVFSVAAMALKPFAAVLGGTFLVAMKAVAGAVKLALTPINAFADFLKRNIGAVQVLTGAVLAFTVLLNASTIATKISAAATWAWGIVMKGVSAITTAFNIVLGRLNATMAFNPTLLWIGAFTALAAAFVIAWQKSETFRNIVTQVFDTVAKYVGGAIGFVLKTLGKLILAYAEIMNTTDGMGMFVAKWWNLIAKVVGSVVGFVLKMFGTWLEGLADFLLENGKAFNALVKIVTFLPNQLLNAVKAVLGLFKVMLNGVGILIEGAADKIADFAEKMANLIAHIPGMGGLANVIRQAAGAVRTGGAAIRNGLDGVGNAIVGVVEKVGEFQAKMIDPATYTGVVKGIKTIGATLKKVAEKAFDFANADVGTKLVNGLLSVATAAGNTLVNIGDKIAEYTSSGFTDKITAAIGDTIDAIKEKLGFGASAVQTAADEYAKTAADAAATVDPAADVAKQADTMLKVRDALKKGIDAIYGVLEDLKNAAADFAKSLKDSITSFAGLKGIELPDGFVPQAKSLVRNMEMRLQASQKFASQIGSLQALGLNADSLRSILEEGPIKGAQLAASILSGGLDAVKQINQLESQIQGIGAAVGLAGATGVYAPQVAATTAEIAALTAGMGSPTATTVGNNVYIQDGAFQVKIDISGAKSPEETVQLITDGIEAKFAELARALAAKTGA